MTLLDEPVNEFRVSQLSQFYEAIEYHYACFTPVGFVVRQAVAVLSVAVTIFTIFVILRRPSSSGLNQTLLVVQIVLSCTLSVFMTVSGIYTIHPFPITFTTSSFGKNWTMQVVIIFTVLLIAAIDAAAYALLRNGIIAKHCRIGGWSHAKTLCAFRYTFFCFYVVVPLLSFPMFLASFQWDQRSRLYPQAIAFDPRLSEFLRHSSPYFCIFNKIILVLMVEVLAAVVVMIGAFVFLIFTPADVTSQSMKIRRTRRVMVRIQIFSVVFAVVTVILPVTTFFILIFNSPQWTIWTPINLVIVLPMQVYNPLQCATTMILVPSFRQSLTCSAASQCTRKSPNNSVLNKTQRTTKPVE